MDQGSPFRGAMQHEADLSGPVGLHMLQELGGFEGDRLALLGTGQGKPGDRGQVLEWRGFFPAQILRFPILEFPIRDRQEHELADLRQ